MPDHVHAVLRMHGENSLSTTLHSWKSYTAHAINKLRGVNGYVWLKDSYTRIVRSEDDLYQKANYVLNNPCKDSGESEYKWCGSQWD